MGCASWHATTNRDLSALGCQGAADADEGQHLGGTSGLDKLGDEERVVGLVGGEGLEDEDEIELRSLLRHT